MVITLSAYLAGIVFWMLKYKRDRIYGIEGIYDLIGYFIAMLIWPYWIVMGMIQVFKKSKNGD